MSSADSPRDVLHLAEPVLLALEQEVGVRQPPVLQGLDDDLRLRWRDHLVLVALEDQQGAGQELGVPDR
jgi:hypothetical protein